MLIETKNTIKEIFVKEGLIPFGYNSAKPEETTTVFVYAMLFERVLKDTLKKSSGVQKEAILLLLEEIYKNFPDDIKKEE